MYKDNLTIRICDGLSIEMIYVEGDLFSMGSEDYDDEKLVHPVRVSSFYMGRYPVIQGIWQAVMQDNPSIFSGANRPVETVSWDDIQAFIKKLNRSASSDFRLPFEAEWEYASRGGRKSKGFLYSGSDKLKEVGWYQGNSYGETKPVGLKFANELGLYDMSGNVWEWCGDWYGEDYYSDCAKRGVVEDPQGPYQGVCRVLRGGGAFNIAVDCRSTIRNHYHPGNHWSNYGFRLVLPVQSVG